MSFVHNGSDDITQVRVDDSLCLIEMMDKGQSSIEEKLVKKLVTREVFGSHK